MTDGLSKNFKALSRDAMQTTASSISEKWMILVLLFLDKCFQRRSFLIFFCSVL